MYISLPEMGSLHGLTWFVMRGWGEVSKSGGWSLGLQEPHPKAIPTGNLNDEVELRFPTVQEIQGSQEEEIGKTGGMSMKKEGRLYTTAHGRVYVPERLRGRILSFDHFGQTGVHQGVNKAVARLRRTFWWPKLATDVQLSADRCLTCKRRRDSLRNPPLGRLDKPYAGAMIALDFMGPIAYNDIISSRWSTTARGMQKLLYTTQQQ
eukprot:GHVQ01038971.1.p1 GENE.GHVQ01038971.1~~GHVQ01038971.1.p1  ORF type:complete len:207 (-),score=14.79 GHVQ01038971.1:146-766(-)